MCKAYVRKCILKQLQAVVSVFSTAKLRTPEIILLQDLSKFAN